MAHRNVSSSGKIRSSPAGPTGFKVQHFSYIIEIIDFSSSAKTEDFERELDPILTRNYGLKWVNDKVCLLILPSVAVAKWLLDMQYRLLNGFCLSPTLTTESQWKIVKSPGDWAKPFLKRPRFLMTPARRMIHLSLGLPFKITEEQRQLENAVFQRRRTSRKGNF